MGPVARPHRAVAVKRRAGAPPLRSGPLDDSADAMGRVASMAFDGADRPLCGRFCPSKAIEEKTPETSAGVNPSEGTAEGGASLATRG